MTRGKKPPLFRRVNTTAHGVHHDHGGDYRETRSQGLLKRSMGARARRGLDYTPLFRFLLSKVGQPWPAVHAEARARLDRPDPIWWMVARHEHTHTEGGYFRAGASSYWSTLRVDADGLLQRMDPALGPESMVPSCPCCTHTFNGVRFTQPFPGR